ncbi:lytic transglycosylase domain-containing protein [Roseovarius mucosus]|uniref:lytic transglycosylase domain-containing protein n=1 Tax=Roseovarius mucosus TaxID=215743 RepID=UPI001C606C61|nr:lytic transglycosylase domain-containing protein [Roseovarius mucosus]MBW4974505.1 lytic transglycosylase domain-containing protein [Roseovarius mucosus]
MQEMLRALIMVLGLSLLVSPGYASDLPRQAPRPLASALDAMQAGRWEVAARLARRDGIAAADLIEWHRLRAGLGEPDAILDFLGRNAHWPGLDFLRQQSEEPMTHADFDDVLAFYKGYTPQTGTGALNLARALQARGRQGEAEIGLVLAWRTLDLTGAENQDFLREFGALLAPHHEARLEMALWRGLADVTDMLPLVPEEARRLAKLRETVKRDGGKGLTEAEARNPGIAFELFTRHLSNAPEDAIAVLLRQSRIKAGLGEPERWASWRRTLARQSMRAGEAQLAYDIASVHQLVEGANFADLEWLSGYLALTYLDAPELALDHFQRFRAAVATPISLGRAGYWIGRTQEALGDPEAAQLAYAEGAEYQTSFYGLLAAEAGKVAFDLRLAGTEGTPDWRGAAFAQTDLHEIGTLALRMNDLSLARRFFLHLAEAQDRTGLMQMGHMLEDLKQPHLQVMLGKTAAERGVIVERPYYALHPMVDMDLPTPMELALAIARRESEFNHVVVSGAGAQGLMQLMPGTARDMARDLGLLYVPSDVLNDWVYNARLGSAYLAGLGARFGGNIVLVSVGYNAGPGRAAQWIEQYGDPRGRDAHGIVDWIEHIPFRETQNYVMRVSESLPAYRARLGKDPLPRPFSEELAGNSVAPVGE